MRFFVQRRQPRVIASVLIVMAVAAGFGMQSLKVGAVESQGIGAVPANPRADNPRSKTIFIYEAKPSQTVRDAIKVVNNTDHPKTIQVYAVDSEASSDGAFACAQAVDKKESVGSWIALKSNKVTVQPFKTSIVPFTVTIPKKADVGEHNGCLVIQDASASAKQNQNGIVLTFRSAIRVAITVPGKIVTSLKLDGVEQKASKGDTITITPAYTNDGNVSVDTTIDVTMKNIFGVASGQAGGQFPVLPKTSSKFNFEVEKPFWGGLYKREVATSFVALTDQKAGVTAKTLPTESALVFVAPRPTALAVEILVPAFLAVAAIVVLRRRREHAELLGKTVPYRIKKGDNIQSLAKKYDVSWKLLAKLNKLKPPYALTAGEELKVPAQEKPENPKKSEKRPKSE